MRAIAATAALALYFALALSFGSNIAGGSDSSGYLNSARLFRQGRVSEPVAGLERLGMPGSDQDIFIPLGFRSGPAPGTMVPLYSPGLPLHLAAAAAIGGWERAPFGIVPLCAVASLILLYGVGRELGLPEGLASAGALLLAGCPIFLGMALQPMSDVPATAWVLAAIFFGVLSRRRPGAAFLAGAALGVAVLVRPTNALAVIPLAFALARNGKAFLRAAAGFVPVGAALLAYNTAAFGNPFETGYGSVFLSRLWVPPNLRHYGYWVSALLTPLVPLAWGLLVLFRRVTPRDRLLLFCWFAVFPAFYALTEEQTDWWVLRYLLPGLPAMILAALLMAREILTRLDRPAGRRVAAAAGIAFLAAAIALDVRNTAKLALFSMKLGQMRDVVLWRLD